MQVAYPASVRTIELTLGPDRFPILVGRGLTGELSRWLASRTPDTALLVTDDTVLALHGGPILAALRAICPVEVLTFPAGETSKNMRKLEQLLEQAAAFGVTKRTIVISLGGGVVGNVAGMVAGLLLRGIPLIHVPTTVLAQIDAAISRKQAVNGRHGKNLFGLWRAPEAIFADFDYLGTLSRRQIRTGLAEAIKLALIGDLALFERFARLTLDDVLADQRLLEDILLRAIDLTCAILARDPSEGTSGLSLEIGHTIGHAVEILRAAELTHGEAIAIGMVVEADLSARRGLLDVSWPARIRAVLEHFELPTRLPAGVDAHQIFAALHFDNKRTSRTPTFVPLKNLGSMDLRARSVEDVTIALADLEKAISIAAHATEGVLQG